MSSLVVHELVTELSQEFTVKNNYRLHVYSVRPYLFFNNEPSGTFTLSLYNGATLLDSSIITFAQIQAALNTTNKYIAAYCRFSFSNIPILNPGTYELRLTSSGYTYEPSIYAGWISLHEDLINSISYEPMGDEEKPLTFQLWGYRWLEL